MGKILSKIRSRIRAGLRCLSRGFYKRIELVILVAECPDPASEGSGSTRPAPGYRTAEALRTLMQAGHAWRDEEMKRRERLGDRCFVVMDSHRCVHYSWMTLEKRECVDIGYEIKLNEKDAWVYDCYTSPTHRGRSLFPKVLRSMLEEFGRRGGKRIWVDIFASNRSSLQAAAKAGFVEIARLEKEVLFSSFVLHQKKTILNEQRGEFLEALPSRWVSPRRILPKMESDWIGFRLVRQSGPLN
jgi:L-amino acid N-acyltransferase YncA